MGPPAAAAVARLDAVLRRLVESMGTVPPLRRVRLTSAGALLVVAKGDVVFPHPWAHTDQGWELAADVGLDEVGPEPRAGVAAPYPMLVTIGADEGGTWLVNLEQCGVLRVGGDPQMRDDFVRYVAAELATTPWATQVRAACLGPASALAAMTERFSSSLDDLPEVAQQTVQDAAALSVDVASARVTQAGDRVWPALVVVTDTPTSVDALVVGNADRSGTGVVIAGDAGDLTVSAQGFVTGWGLSLVAVGLTADEAAGCAALVAAVDVTDDEPVAQLDDYVDLVGTITAAADRGDPEGSSLLDAPDTDYTQVAAVTVEELPRLAPTITSTVREELTDPSLDADLAAWDSSEGRLPRLRVLGPVVAKTLGKPLAKSRAYYTEVLAFLVLRRRGATREEVAAAFGISVERARTIISQLRSWLGVNPLTGEKHLPDAKTAGVSGGVGVYRVEGVLSDWDLFRRLRTRAQATGTIEDLDRALQLVTGRPFDQLRPGGWTWLLEGDRIDQHATVAIIDVAHTVTTRRLQEHNFGAARAATEVALRVSPGEQISELDLASIQVAEGDRAAAERILAGVGQTLDEETGVPADLPQRAYDILRRTG